MVCLVSLMHHDLGYVDLEQRTLQTIDDPFGTRLSPRLRSVLSLSDSRLSLLLTSLAGMLNSDMESGYMRRSFGEERPRQPTAATTYHADSYQP